MTKKQIIKRLTKGVAIGVSVALLLTLLPAKNVQADTASDLEKSIKEKQEQIKKEQDEKNKIKSNITDVKKLKAELEKNKNDLSAYVTELDHTVMEINDKIDGLNVDIQNKQDEIDATKKELEEAIDIRNDQYASMKKRVQAIYEQGDNYYLELLFTTHGFGDFLNSMENINKLADYDSKMYARYQETVDYVDACEQKLESEEQNLQELKQAAEDEKKATEELIQTKQQEIQAYQADIANKAATLAEYEAELASRDAIIAEIEKAVAEAQSKLAQQRVYDGGTFCWPAPSYTRVSSEYGYRIHPIYGTQKFHSGVDLAAPGGSDILAAYDGTVVAAAYNASMGNYVMIDHGGSLMTIYMHASRLLVSSGQEVSRGQRIALVGTTGNSTGNHLHFTVKLNGQYVSPWGYIPHP
ncbi:MAG: peptidoglycan DD-metalloendopeptidase family protein [Lachnospiraceae bacterium]|nr:peptidoglycan DD-metalloendopeptidase family protein [Lachnospiraceae bacterium]